MVTAAPLPTWIETEPLRVSLLPTPVSAPVDAVGLLPSVPAVPE